MAVQLPGGFEAVLDDVAPGLAPGAVVAEGGQCHPQVAGRQSAQFVAQTSGGASVVGDGDDGCEVFGEQTERPQRRVESVAAAEGDDVGSIVLCARGDDGQIFGLHVILFPDRGGARSRECRSGPTAAVRRVR